MEVEMNASRAEAATAAASQPDPSWRSLYRVGGWSGLIIVVPYLAAIVLVSAAPPPLETGGAETLEYVASHKVLYAIEQVAWMAPGVLAMVLFLALTAALWRLDKGYAAIAGLIGTSAWALTLALPTSGGGSPVLVDLADRYANAASPGQRTGLAAVAEGFLAENNTPSIVGVLTTVGILLISLVMTRGVFPRWVAYLGIGTGAVGVVSEALRPMLGAAYSIYGIALLAWFLAVGTALLRLGRPVRVPRADQAEALSHR
jgi:hypothetical protein